MFKNQLVIDLEDWDELVRETYGKIYSFQQQDGCKDRGIEYVDADMGRDYKNDSVPEIVNHKEMGVSFAAWLARDIKQPLKDEEDGDRDCNIELWWERNFYPSVRVLAADLFVKGLIPSESFAIEIDW